MIAAIEWFPVAEMMTLAFLFGLILGIRAVITCERSVDRVKV